MSGTTIRQMRDDIVAGIRAHFSVQVVHNVFGLPCEIDGEYLERFAVKAPAIVVCPIGSPSTSMQSHVRACVVQWGAFILTKGRDRKEDGPPIAEQLLTLIPANRWGNEWVRPVQDLQARNLGDTDLCREGLALWGVFWQQGLDLVMPVAVTLQDWLRIKAEWNANGGDQAPHMDDDFDL